MTEDWPCVLTGAPTGTGVPDHNTGKTKRAQVEGLGGGGRGGMEGRRGVGGGKVRGGGRLEGGDEGTGGGVKQGEGGGWEGGGEELRGDGSHCTNEE